MLLDKDKSGFILVDVQEKLTPLVLNATALVQRCEWLMRLVKAMDVPMLVSEQYPRGLGKTVESLQVLMKGVPSIEKVHFSCYREPKSISLWEDLGRKQVVLAGIETHVCVLQTAMDMHALGFDVFVVADAVSSRHEVDHRYGLKRMKQAGIQLVTAEMVFFEWVGQAGTPEFKSLSQTFFA
ncbi:MAG: hydrolase [Legionellales bacterium]|nr:hydrolase [Legionellales bacterium]